MSKAITTAWIRLNGQITIPKRIREELGLEIGDQIKIIVEKFPELTS